MIAHADSPAVVADLQSVSNQMDPTGLLERSVAACPYCSGMFDPDRITRPSWDESILDGGSTMVVPSRGSLVDGWLLAVPRAHVLSSALLSTADRAGLHNVLAQARALLGQAYGPIDVFVFEHGAHVPASVVGCGVDHVHMHLIPLPFDLVAAAQRHELGRVLRWSRFASWDSFYRAPESAEPYVVVEGAEELWVGTGIIPSQFFRRVIATELGMADRFDWKRDDGCANVRRTLERLVTSTAESTGTTPNWSRAYLASASA